MKKIKVEESLTEYRSLEDLQEQTDRLDIELIKKTKLFHDNVKIARNHLDNLKRFLGKPTKKPLSPEQIEKARYYVSCANDYVAALTHNLDDLAVLTDVRDGTVEPS